MLGVMGGFEQLGWSIKPYIVGDRMPARVRTRAEKAMTASRWHLVASDLIRLGMGPVVSQAAWHALGSDVDIVYERLGAFQTIGGIFKRRGIPWVLESNCLYFVESSTDRNSVALNKILRRLEIAAYRGADLVVCVSDPLRELIVQAADINPGKVVVMPNAVDVDRLAPDQAAPVRLFSGLTIGFVGYLIAWQGLDILLTAVSELRLSGVDMFVSIVGDGPEMEPLKSLVESLGITERVRFVGRVSPGDVPAYIAGFDLGYSGQIPLSAGEMYNSPLKLYEYMAMAKPVIASCYADARSLVEGKGTGFLFPSGDVAALVVALTQAVEQREWLNVMGMNARRLVKGEHGWSARVSQLMPHIEKLIRRA